MKKVKDKVDEIFKNQKDLDILSKESYELTMELLHSVWKQRNNYDTVEEALLYILKK